jgi:hypothetical protein
MAVGARWALISATREDGQRQAIEQNLVHGISSSRFAPREAF